MLTILLVGCYQKISSLKVEMCGNDFRLPIPSHSHSQPSEILDYIPIFIYSRKVILIPSYSHSHWNKKSLKKLL